MSIWTENEIVHLLREMKNYPILYNRARDFSTDQNEYVAAIQAIEIVVNKPWPEIKSKWNKLRSYHKVCYNKQLKTKEKPAWMYYDLMDYAIDSEYAHSADQEDSDEDPSEDKAENFRGFKTDAKGTISEERLPKRRKSCPALSQSRSQQAEKSARISSSSTTTVRHSAVEGSSSSAINEAVESNENHVQTKDSRDYIDIISFKLRDIGQRFGEREGKVAALSIFECLSRFEMEATDRFLANQHQF